MDQHLQRCDHDREILPQAPAGEIFEVGIETVGEVARLLGRAAVAADLARLAAPDDPVGGGDGRARRVGAGGRLSNTLTR